MHGGLIGLPLPRRENNFRILGSVTQGDDSLLVMEAVGVVVSAFLFTPFFSWKKHGVKYVEIPVHPYVNIVHVFR